MNSSEISQHFLSLWGFQLQTFSANSPAH